ncbi:MAG: methylmalonyl-CoA carboxyltransferase, partial [Acidobacteria bacterium]|nr:methylmalonyl-CoA carboxyltransferase [Acidobacteriota bacterium]
TKTAEYQEKFASPWVAAERGYIDEVIEPSLTRSRLIRGLRLLDNKRDGNPRRKHGNSPL